MIRRETILTIADNSGGRFIKCISLKNLFKEIGVGSFFRGCIKKLRRKRRSKSKVKKGNLYLALVIQIKSPVLRKNSKVFLFKHNFCIIIGKYNEPLATRIFQGVPKEARRQRKSKLFIMAPFLY
jgi:large subunit ribosomal protein L14